MKLVHTSIQGVYEVTAEPFCDDRGQFSRLFCIDELANFLNEKSPVQFNHSKTNKAGTIRGMHFQRQPFCESKVVWCLQGSVFDVAVDLRPKSPTYLSWTAVNLSRSSNNGICIPEGVAHGFLSLEDHCELLYVHTEKYEKQAEDGIRFDDPAISIRWPKEIEIVSDRDLSYAPITHDFTGIEL